jgi:hypothetical protein
MYKFIDSIISLPKMLKNRSHKNAGTSTTKSPKTQTDRDSNTKTQTRIIVGNQSNGQNLKIKFINYYFAEIKFAEKKAINKQLQS